MLRFQAITAFLGKFRCQTRQASQVVSLSRFVKRGRGVAPFPASRRLVGPFLPHVGPLAMLSGGTSKKGARQEIIFVEDRSGFPEDSWLKGGTLEESLSERSDKSASSSSPNTDLKLEDVITFIDD